MSAEQLAAEVLWLAKNLAATRSPAPSPGMANVWAQAVPFDRFPRELWLDAVRRWGQGDKPLDVGTLIRAAYAVRDEWEGNPAKRRMLEQRRNAYLRHREALGELPPGTTQKPSETTSQTAKRGDEKVGQAYIARFKAERAARNAENAPTQTPKHRHHSQAEEHQKRQRANQLHNERQTHGNNRH